ncbi:hypothetical protein ESA94_10650 [Lacibacter luteus]|uniref:DUF2911 domain-containing protein n=1 Tax=Lacibacter luteus TaxID=2508719 RepID=A0A4Q1CJV5_9BACT|nr:hypothetical protein [Lacibacter luteus]RXK60906.1 hypothetical protein ESA94_10650 [Lacibacter luteus]
MKKITLFITMLATASMLVAQKVDLDRFNFRYLTRTLPTNPLPDGYKTYHFNIASSASVREVYNDDRIKQTLTLNGLKHNEGKGHITINMNLGEVSLKNPELKEREEVIKDKDGKETGRKKYYWIEAVYAWTGEVNVTDYKGTKLYSTTIGVGNTIWKGAESENKGTPGDYYNNNKYAIRSAIATDVVTNSMQRLSFGLNRMYGYGTITDADFLWLLDSKKHPENDAMKKAWASFKEAVSLMNEKDEITPVKEKMIPVIQYLDSLKTRITGTEKADKKLRYAAYYSLAKIYLILDEPDKAIKEAELLIVNDYDTNDGKTLISLANDLKASFEKNKINTRHFPIDISKYSAPEGN